MSREFYIHTLKNGIRVIHKPVAHTRVAHCGFVLDIGSRDENQKEQGLAHFWEHMAFKGTKTRKTHQIINRLESVGGELNAYTTKEKIFFYSSILDQHYERALELLTDITFHSVFPEKEIVKERSVILEEMSMYEDTPEESIHDEFEQVVFKTHALGHNILGTRSTVNSFKRIHFTRFIKEHLDTNRIVFSSVGNIPFEKVVEYCEKHFSSIKLSPKKYSRTKFKGYKKQFLQKEKAIGQAHCMIGGEAYKLEDPNRLVFFMLNNILGGPAMSAKLNMVLREKHGLAYTVESSYSPYVDTGLFGVYFGTDKKTLTKAHDLTLKEIKSLRDKLISGAMLRQYKQQLIGQLAMAEENNSGFMQMMGKSLLDFNRVDSLEYIVKKIEEVSAKKLRDVSNEILNENKFSTLIYLPNE